jgi:hypothetical protein
MWTYNVVRELFKSSNYTVKPRQIPTTQHELVREALTSSVVENEVYCIKTHLHVKNPLPTQHAVKIICNVRDVRDACLSWMRFMRADFSRSLKAMIGMMKTTDYFHSTFKQDLLSIRYEDMNTNPADTINRICDYLELVVAEGQRQRIENQFSKASMKHFVKTLSKIKIDRNGNVENPLDREQFEVVENYDGTFRVFDKMTAFQSDHITSQKDGEWRACLTEEQIAQLNDVAKNWLMKYNYGI